MDLLKMNKPFLIFLVDDDPIFLKMMETQFKDETQYEVKTFFTGEDCLKGLSLNPNIIFLDYNLNTSNPKSQNGLQILDKIKSVNHSIHVVMLSSQESIDIALNCIKHDAFDYIIKSNTAFIRAQKTIIILFNQIKLEKLVRFYKTTSITILISIACSVLATILMELFSPFFFKLIFIIKEVN